MKRNVVEAPEGSRIFVLLSDMLSKNVARDKKSALGQIVLRERALQIGCQRFEYIHTDARRRPQPGAGRNLRGEKQIDRDVAVHLLEDGEWNFQHVALKAHVGDVVPSLAYSKVGGDHLHTAVRSSTQNGVEVLVDGCAQNRAAKLFIIGRQVSSPAAKANPNWTANYEHWTTSPRILCLLGSRSRRAGRPPAVAATGIVAALLSTRSEEATKCPGKRNRAKCIADRTWSCLPKNSDRASHAPVPIRLSPVSH